MRLTHVIGHLDFFWGNVLEQKDDGDISSWPDELIAEYSDAPCEPRKWVELLKKHSFLVGGLVRNWIRYAGPYLTAKYKGKNREKLCQIWAKHGLQYGKEEGRSKSFLTPHLKSWEQGELLKSLVLRNNPTSKTPKNLLSWVTEIDKLKRIDGKSDVDVEAVIRWCQDDLFWRSNILSGGKLREKFDQLFLKMKDSNGMKVRPGSPAPETAKYANRDE